MRICFCALAAGKMQITSKLLHKMRLGFVLSTSESQGHLSPSNSGGQRVYHSVITNPTTGQKWLGTSLSQRCQTLVTEVRRSEMIFKKSIQRYVILKAKYFGRQKSVIHINRLRLFMIVNRVFLIVYWLYGSMPEDNGERVQGMTGRKADCGITWLLPVAGGGGPSL